MRARVVILVLSTMLALVAVAVSAQSTSPSSQQISLASGIPVAVAILAATVAYIFNIRLEKRKAELKFVSEQLQYLYGPLTSLSSAGTESWLTFRSGCRPKGPFFSEHPPLTQEELEEWRLWMSEVFMPINLKMEKVIIENSHLIKGRKMPEPFLSLLAHTASYRAVMKKWPDLPVSVEMPIEEITLQNAAALNFPMDLDEYVVSIFNQLKKRQSKLIGS